MKIKQDFPFDFCESCNECVLNVTDNTLYADNTIVIREITISCRNEAVCKNIKKAMEVKQNDTDTGFRQVPM